MLWPRITPCLLVHNGGLVKTVNFAQPKYVGDPLNAVKIFNEKEADELIVLDIDATVHEQEPNFRLVSQLAMECRMPLCYGGGIKTLDQARRIITLGVEKVALSSAALEDPGVVRQIADELGSQSVVVVLDVKKRRVLGGYEVMTRNGKVKIGMSANEAAMAAESQGAGEIVINSIDQDGRMQGYDLELASTVRANTSLPLTILGGAGSLDDIVRLVRTCGVLGAAAGSLFVFKGALRGVLINYPNPSEKNAVLETAMSRG